MPYTKEQLLNNSAMSKILARQGKFVKGVLSTEEQNVLASQYKNFQVITNGKVFWFTDDYNMVFKLLPPEFVSSSTMSHQTVPTRFGLPDGVIRTAEDFVKVYHQDERQIQTIDELIQYLNENY